MHVLLAGASGFLGTAAVRAWQRSGTPVDRVTRLVRRAPDGPDQVRWNPGGPDAAATRDTLVRLLTESPAGTPPVDAVINLAGASIARPWTSGAKAAIRSSRIDTTATLADAIAESGRTVTFVTQSGVGGYGEDCGETVLTEQTPLGTGFLAELVGDWEGAADPARTAGSRVAHLRCGVVFAHDAPAYRLLSIPFKLGLGGRLGSGRQFMAMSTLADWLTALDHVLTTDSVSGPVNVCLPHAPRNSEFTRELARALHRPAVVPVPGIAMRAVLGGFAWELIGSANAAPTVLLDSGFTFAQPSVADVVAATVHS